MGEQEVKESERIAARPHGRAAFAPRGEPRLRRASGRVAVTDAAGTSPESAPGGAPRSGCGHTAGSRLDTGAHHRVRGAGQARLLGGRVPAAARRDRPTAWPGAVTSGAR